MKIKLGGVLLILAATLFTGGASASELTSPAWVAEDSFEFKAVGDSTPADPLDTELLADRIASLEAAHETKISRPAAEAEREVSIDAFADLGPLQAKELLLDTFGSQLEALTTLPTEPLLESESPVDFLSDNSARIDPPGAQDSLLVVSDTSLRNDEDEIISGELAPAPDGFAPVAPLADVRMPEESTGEVTFPEVGVSFGFEDAGQSAGRLISAAEGDGKEMVFYPNTNTDTDTAITYTSTGVETFNYLRSEDSPETVSLDYSLPEDASLAATPDGGAVATDSGGEELLTIFPPYAVDAQGTFVPMSLSVEGNSIVMDVPHRGKDFAYPIMVDPVQHVRTWWTDGASPGAAYEGWSFQQSGTSNFNSSTTCPSAVLPGDPCGGTGAGVYISAVPGKTYPADSKGYWRWTAPGGTSTSITEATLSSWRYRKGGASSGSPYAFFNLSPTGTGYTTNTGSGGSGLTLTGSSNDTKYLHVGLASTSATTLPAGNSNWRYNRLAGYTATLTDGEPPSLGLSGAPTGWTGPNAPFTVTATAADPGLGLGWIKAQTDGVWSSKWTAICTGTYPLPCPNGPFNASLAFNSNDFPSGINTVPVKAVDVVAGSGHELTQNFDLRVDRTGPAITTSGPLSSGNGVGNELTVRIDDHALSNPAFDSGGNLTPVPSPADYPNLRSGAKEFKLYVDDQLVLTRSRTCSVTIGSCRIGPETLSPDLSSLADGLHEFKVLATDQAGNSSTATWQKDLDRTPPEVASARVSSDWQTQAEVQADVAVSDGKTGISRIEIEDEQGLVAVRFLDCGGPAGCPSTYQGQVGISADNLSEGRNVLKVYAVDRAGFRSEPKLVLPDIDRNPAVFESVDAPVWASTSADLQVSASNEGSGVERLEVVYGSGEVLVSKRSDCSEACPSEVNETLAVDISGIPVGSDRSLTVVAYSGAGTQAEEQIGLGVERTAPALDSLSGSLPALAGEHLDSNALKTVSTGASDSSGGLASGLEKIGIRDSVADWHAELDCSVVDCSSAALDLPLADLADAEHSIEVYATDKAGNEVTDTITFTLDRSGPEIAIGTTADQNAGIRDGGEDLDFWVSINDVPEVSDGVVSANVKVDGQTVSPEPCEEACTVDTYRIQGLQPGSHEVTVGASDSLGHASQFAKELLLDSEPPEIQLSGSLEDGAEVGAGSKDLEVMAIDPGTGDNESGVSQVIVEVDGQTVREFREPCGSGDCDVNQTYQFEEDELSLGTHHIRVSAMDEAGNLAEEQISVRRTCEAAPPVPVTATNPISPAAAVSNVETYHPDVVAASDVSEVNGKQYEPTLIEDPGALLSEDTREPSELPDESDGTTVVGSGEQAICLVAGSLAAESDPPEVLADDSAIYPNTAQDTDTVVRPNVSGVETFEILRSEAAPESFRWEIGSPLEQTVSERSDGSLSVEISGEELDVLERPEADPAFEGDAQRLVQEGDLPTGTVDAMDDPFASAGQRVREEVSDRPEDGEVAAALPGGGPSGVPAAPPQGNPTPNDLPTLLDQFEQAAAAESDEVVAQSLAEFDAAESTSVQDSQDQAEQVVLDGLGEIQGDTFAIATVEAPVANDATGQSVPVELGTNGENVEMSVDHAGPGPDYAYPIAVDPFVTVWTTVIDWEPYPVYREERYVSGSDVTLRQVGWWDARYCEWINCSAEATPGWFEVADRFRVWLPSGLSQGATGPLYQAFHQPVYSTRTVFDRWEYKPVTRQVSSLDWQDTVASVSATLGVPSGWDRGMNFVGFDRSAFGAGAGNGSVDAARNQLGIKTAVLVPHWYTRTGGSSNIFRTGKTPTDSGLEALARHARNQLDMKVVIKPHIDSLDDAWRGQMQFSNRNAFWNDYTRIILDYADMAEDVNAHGLVIGTELSKVEHDQPDKWRKLIGQVRNRFDGMVYYAANWDTVLSVNSIPDWFGLLDVIGIDYYRDNSNRSAQQMWKNIEDVRERFGNGVVLTESGGNSSSGNQKLHYSATNSAMMTGRNKSWFKGIWWYNRFTLTSGGYGKTWNEFTPNKSTSKWLCKKQTQKSNGECSRLIERAWK